MNNPKAQVNAINDPFMDTDYLIYLLKYDSVHGKIFLTTKVDSKVTFKNVTEEFKLTEEKSLFPTRKTHLQLTGHPSTQITFVKVLEHSQQKKNVWLIKKEEQRK